MVVLALISQLVRAHHCKNEISLFVMGSQSEPRITNLLGKDCAGTLYEEGLIGTNIQCKQHFSPITQQTCRLFCKEYLQHCMPEESPVEPKQCIQLGTRLKFCPTVLHLIEHLKFRRSCSVVNKRLTAFHFCEPRFLFIWHQ